MKDLFLSAFGLMGLILLLAGCIGWIRNLIQLFSASFDPLTGEVVLKIIGIFIAPLGAVMGWV